MLLDGTDPVPLPTYGRPGDDWPSRWPSPSRWRCSARRGVVRRRAHRPGIRRLADNFCRVGARPRRRPARRHRGELAARRQPADGRRSRGRNFAHQRRAGRTAHRRGGPTGDGPTSDGPASGAAAAGREPALAHEAEWVPNPDGGATPALYSAYFRPNADYPSQIVGVAWINQALTSTHLFAGTAEPVPGTTPAAAQVPHDLRGRLVAVFNSGWKTPTAAAASIRAGSPWCRCRTAPPRWSSTRRGASRSAGGAATPGWA